MPDLTASPHGFTRCASSTASAFSIFEGKGTVTALFCRNNTGSTIYLMLLDMLAANLSSGETADDFPSIAIANGSYYESSIQRGFATGCQLGFSSDSGTYTAIATPGAVAEVGFRR